MSLRRTLILGPTAIALSIALAACGSRLEPKTVAAANGSSDAQRDRHRLRHARG